MHCGKSSGTPALFDSATHSTTFSQERKLYQEECAMVRRLLTAVACVCGVRGLAQTVQVPNPSFERGAAAPLGWSLSQPAGKWARDKAPDGERFIAVTGTGEDTNYWRTSSLALAPATTYRLSFKARSIDCTGGTPITGPVFCNRDLHGIPDEWRLYSSVFVTPQTIDPDAAWIRFGQWHAKGTIAFDDVTLETVQPVYRRSGRIALGAGEAVRGSDYHFQAPFYSDSRNTSRCLVSQQCGFNTNRWVFGANSHVTYWHELPGREQRTANVEVGVTYYQGGELVVEASGDGKRWQVIATQDELGTVSASVPADLLPADAVRIRLRARAKQELGTESDPGSFQVSAYSYTATLAGPGLDAKGETRFLAVRDAMPGFTVQVTDLGDALPGGRNTVQARVVNTTGKPLTVVPTVALFQNGVRRARTEAGARVLAQGEYVVRCAYEDPPVGETQLVFSLGKAVTSRCEADLFVPDFYAADYGERLPVSSADAVLWWTHSGWKVPQSRPAPDADGQAVLIRAARNEADAAQLVIRPARGIQDVRLTKSDLKSAAGDTVAASEIDVLKVRYVPVTRPTDRTGVAAPWPDPLPPLPDRFDLAAGVNQPLWLRVKVPRDAKAGLYKGRIQLTAPGFNVSVPLQLEVYGFTLPDRMTCTTAFGFSPSAVWRYQKITDAQQQRQVLDKYLQNFADHHISPYDPAPLDPLKVTWPASGDWTGGTRDRTVRHAGQSSLCVRDTSEKTTASARATGLVPIPFRGLALTFWYKTADPGHHFIVTLNHHDDTGAWMSGRNNDIRVTGTGEWQQFRRTITRFPVGAKGVRLTLWATLYGEPGTATGTVWYDDVALTNAGTGESLIPGGDFEPLDIAALKPEFDWSAWDGAMQRAIDHYRFNSFRLRIQGLGGGTFHARSEPSLLGYSEDTPEYKAAFGAYCRELEAHLEQKGWLDEAFVYWFDEPDPKDYEFVSNGFRKLKAAAPRLRRMLTEQVEEGLVGGPNIWCPVSHHYDHEDAERRRREGEHFWWYVCTGPKAPYCTLFIDHPATELRVWLWQTWKRKVEGILVWATNYWTSGAAYPDPAAPQNPYEDAMGWVSGYSTERGTKRPWGNGDGRFIYPPEAAADAQQPETVLDGPVDSIRWEMLRDGIEDYEYLAMLKRLLDEKAARLPAAQRRQFEALLEVPETITTDMTTFTTRPEPIEERRHAIAQAIAQLANR